MKGRIKDTFFQYDNETDSLLQVAENYFVGGKDKWFEAQTCEALSRIAFKEGQGRQIKLDWLQKAYQSMQQCRHVDERLIHKETKQERIDGYTNKIRMHLGMCYLDNDYTQDGFLHIKAAEQYFAKTQKLYMRFFSAHVLGNAYLALKEYDSCKLCYEKSLQAAKEANNAEQIALYHFSMAMCYRYRFDNQDYENEQEGQRLFSDCTSHTRPWEIRRRLWNMLTSISRCSRSLKTSPKPSSK